MTGLHHAKGRGPIINLLKNADFSAPFAPRDWKDSNGVIRGRFPDDSSSDCAILPYIHGADLYLRQTVDIPSTGKYLLTFRYFLVGDAVDPVILGVAIPGSYKPVVLYPSTEGVANHCVVVLEPHIGVSQPLHMSAAGVPIDVEPLQLYIDDVLLAKYEPTPPPLLRNGNFESSDSQDWKLSENATIEDYIIEPDPGRHLVLSSAKLADVYAEQDRIRLERAGKYMLTFTLKHAISEALLRHGRVSLKGEGFDHGIAFEHAGPGNYTKSFIFELKAEEVANEVTLRISKLKNDEQIPVFWFIDDVELIAL